MDPRDWQRRYADKVSTAAEAIRLIRPGRRILIGSGAAEPVALVEALVEHGEHLADNEIVHLLTLGPAPYVEPELAAPLPPHRLLHRRQRARGGAGGPRRLHAGVPLRDPRAHPLAPRAHRRGAHPGEPARPHGYVSLGVSVDIVRAAVDTAALVIAEVNPRMPRTHGDSFVHVEPHRTRLVPVDDAAARARRPSRPDEVAAAIGRHVATLVPDGATLQMGIGQHPRRGAGRAARDRHDLGVHTEMLSDGVMDLVEAGVITGRRKTLLPGKIVTSFVMGTRRALRLGRTTTRPIEMRPSDFTNDPFDHRAQRAHGRDQLGARGRPHRPGGGRHAARAGSSRASAGRSTSSAARRAAGAASPSSRCPRRRRAAR